MCKFFSFISDGEGNCYYFSAEQREDENLKDKIIGYENDKSYDSHSVIAEFYKDKFKNPACDNCNKYEIDLIKKENKIDQINIKDDSDLVFNNITDKDKLDLLVWKFKNYNSGDRNSGDRNSGYYNSGYYNSGDYNSGDYNSGNRNSGDYNNGDRNSGYYNSGDYNSGYYNSGDYNSGNRNSGYYNSGDYNSGSCNSGYYNSGYYNSGYFNSNEPNVRVFNKDTNFKFNDNIFTKVRRIINNNFYLNFNLWVGVDDMSDEEKEKHPSYKTTGGYLKTASYKDAWKLMWDNLKEEYKQEFYKLPNFDKGIFKEITGIEVKNDNN